MTVFPGIFSAGRRQRSENSEESTAPAVWRAYHFRGRIPANHFAERVWLNATDAMHPPQVGDDAEDSCPAIAPVEGMIAVSAHRNSGRAWHGGILRHNCGRVKGILNVRAP